MTDCTPEPTRRADRYVVGVALLLPMLVTFLYFVVLADAASTMQQTAYGLGKAIQFLLPVVWVFWIQRDAFRWKRPTASGMLLGIAFGLAVLGAMLALYLLWLKPVGYMDATSSVAKEIQAKVTGFGIDSPVAYWALGAFYALFHSAAEEYYWRWFVFGQLRKLVPFSAAIAISSIGFMLHHVLVLGTYFGYHAPATWAFSFAIAIGGAVWAWLYYRSDSIYAPWISHLVVDAAIFIVGYDIVRELL